jgi:amino acid adenylation domain-containing protein
VGIAAPRSPELVAGLLGILRAGAAYLPLDPAYPEERLRFMLEDAGAPVLLGAAELAPVLAPALGESRWLSLEEALAEGDAAPPADPSGARSLAYVVYTSGSTGRPKGVAVEHRSVARLVRGASYVEMGEDDVFLQMAPVPFDASTFEIWGALLSGGRLDVPRPGVLALAEVGREVESSRPTALFVTTALFNQLVDAELPRLAGARQLITGGETASPDHLARFAAAQEAAWGGKGVLVHAYGPTEGTTFTTCRPVPAFAAPEAAGAPVPIGPPIANTRVHVLQPGGGGSIGLEPVPTGVPGELFVGGDGVARGYHARPAPAASTTRRQ